MALTSDDTPRKVHEVHQKVWESLPWYANGTLVDDELEMVESHVASCVTCRSELKFLRHLGLQIHASPVLEISARRGFANLMSRIEDIEGDEASPAGATDRTASKRGGIRTRFRWRPALLPRLAVAQAALIVLLLGLLVVANQTGSHPSFRTLSTPTPASEQQADLIRVLFAEHANEREIRQLLQDHGAGFVGGPTPLGVYTISLDAELPHSERERVVEELRLSPIVRFADRLIGHQRRTTE